MLNDCCVLCNLPVADGRILFGSQSINFTHVAADDGLVTLVAHSGRHSLDE